MSDFLSWLKTCLGGIFWPYVGYIIYRDNGTTLYDSGYGAPYRKYRSPFYFCINMAGVLLLIAMVLVGVNNFRFESSWLFIVAAGICYVILGIIFFLCIYFDMYVEEYS